MFFFTHTRWFYGEYSLYFFRGFYKENQRLLKTTQRTPWPTVFTPQENLPSSFTLLFRFCPLPACSVWFHTFLSSSIAHREFSTIIQIFTSSYFMSPVAKFALYDIQQDKNCYEKKIHHFESTFSKKINLKSD